MRKLKVLYVVVFFILVSSCNIETEKALPEEPERPDSVPLSAFWVGGLDGGFFVQLEKNLNGPDYTYKGRIFSDQSGKIEYEGILKMDPESLIDISDKDLFNGWDGEKLILMDNRVMRAIE